MAAASISRAATWIVKFRNVTASGRSFSKSCAIVKESETFVTSVGDDLAVGYRC
jgi:hypothetical protein